MHKTLSICLGVVILYIIMTCQTSQFGRYMGGYHIYVYNYIYMYTPIHTINIHVAYLSTFIYTCGWISQVFDVHLFTLPLTLGSTRPTMRPLLVVGNKLNAIQLLLLQRLRIVGRDGEPRRAVEIYGKWFGDGSKPFKTIYIVTDIGGRNIHFHQWFIRVPSRCHRVLTHSHFWIGF